MGCENIKLSKRAKETYNNRCLLKSLNKIVRKLIREVTEPEDTSVIDSCFGAQEFPKSLGKRHARSQRTPL
eukprot:2629629-Rhodomonas_salina.1